MAYDYFPPVDQLLRLGDLRRQESWIEYRALGISERDGDALVRMAVDEELWKLDAEADDEVWAPIHAWRALGQLGVAAAAPALVGLLPRIDTDDDDWVMEDATEALAMIGDAAIAPLAEYLSDPRHGVWSRIAAALALRKAADRHPNLRQRCLDVLADQLRRCMTSPADLNSSIIAELLDLKAVELADVIHQAFLSGRVDEQVHGSWDYVQTELGLTPRKTARTSRQFDVLGSALNDVTSNLLKGFKR